MCVGAEREMIYKSHLFTNHLKGRARPEGKGEWQ